MARLPKVSKKLRGGKWSGYWVSAAVTGENPTGKETTYGHKGCGESIAQNELDKALLSTKGKQIKRHLLREFITEFFITEIKPGKSSPNTIRYYHQFLDPYNEQFGHLNVSQLKGIGDLTTWISEQENWVDKHHPYRALGRFLKWLYLKGDTIDHLYLAQFTSKMPSPLPPKEIEIITPEIHQQILDFVSKNPTYGLSFANFFRLLWSVWGRPADLYNVKCKHVLFNNGEPFIRFKAGEDVSRQKAGGKNHRDLVPDTDEGLKLLAQLAEQCTSPEQCLFRSSVGGCLKQTTVWSRFKHVNKALGTKLVMYSYRKGAISEAVLNGELTPHQIRAQAGWSNLDMLRKYDMVSDNIEHRQSAFKPKNENQS